MKQIEKKDLIKGEIYKFTNNYHMIYLFKFIDSLVCCDNICITNTNIRLNKGTGDFTYGLKTFELATPEEKHWLEVCIAANSFISYNEAIKTFIPEYVECVHSYNNRFIENNIYKVLEYSNIDEPRVTIDNHSYYKHLPFNGGSWKFKPSTKEAYDAQFVVKEPEFVLPEKWCIKSNEEIYDILQNYCSKNIGRKPLDKHKKSVYHFPEFNGVCTNSGIIYNYTEITFEQFKKYVLKEQLEEPKDKVLTLSSNYGKESIVKVECSEGAIYQLGDKIVVFDKSNLNNNKPCTIIGFRWTNDKKEICAITTSHQGLGIRLSKIELYSEPVVKELSLLKQAKLKYPIGTKFKAARGNRNLYIVESNDIFYENSDGAICIRTQGNGTVYYNGTWAEIIENFKLPETWWITIENERQLEIAKQYFSQYFNNLNIFRVGKTVGYIKNVLDNYAANAFNLLTTTKMNNPQITFEQFEKYVLHNGFKVGDKFTKQKYCEVTEKEIIALEYIGNCSIAVYKYTSSNHTSPQCRILTKNIVR